MPQGNGSGRANALPMQGATPFPAGQPRYHIVRAKPGSDAQGVCINKAIHGEEVHYVDGRSHPCRRRERPCLWCQEGNRLRWYGYMPALLPGSGRIGFIEITFEAAKEAMRSFDRGFLRGIGIRVRRMGQSKRGRCVLTFEDVRVQGPLPAEVDTRAGLYAIWDEFVHAPPLPFQPQEVPL